MIRAGAVRIRNLNSAMANDNDVLADSLRLLKQNLQTLSGDFEQTKLLVGVPALTEEFSELQIAMSDPNLWNDKEQALEISAKYGRTKDRVDLITAIETLTDDIGVGLEILSDSPDQGVLNEVEEKIRELESLIGQLRTDSLLSGPYDLADAICEVHAGAGGTDAQDWAEMLMRMYIRWAEKRKFTVEIDEVTEGAQAGILSATFVVKGNNAYGLLANEKGVHRLVRMSPFDSAHRRHTSFAALSVIPMLENDLSVEINESELRTDTFRASGAGGQHINKTDSAVRITHLPTGIVVSCQNERSQLMNKTKAMALLKAKLAELKRQENEEHIKSIAGPNADVAWGSQIRSYVLAPYQQVKDLRTNFEVGDVNGVLNGELDKFLENYLVYRHQNHEDSL